jgi:predicted ATPase
MIKQFRVQNYKALRDVTLELTPLHVLIGPNDSGKSSILEAVAALCRSVDLPLTQSFPGLWEGFDLVWRGNPELTVYFSAQIAKNDQKLLDYHLSCNFLPNGQKAVIHEENIADCSESSPINLTVESHHSSNVKRIIVDRERAGGDRFAKSSAVHDALAGVHYYCWNPRFLALPVAPDSKRRFRMDKSGFGLALCLDDILGFDRDRFARLENRFKSIFPQIKSIKLLPEMAFKAPGDDIEQIPMLQRGDGKGIYFEFSGFEKLVPASQASDGVLLVLAYLTILHLPNPPRVILVEEPENGIHPKRLKDVLTILRDLISEQTHTQIALTTHSPYILDLFDPSEVTLCQKRSDGSIAVCRLSESELVQRQKNIFTLGEIWTAEGDEKLADLEISHEGPQL